MLSFYRALPLQQLIQIHKFNPRSRGSDQLHDMPHRSTRQLVEDLRSAGRLISIDDEVDPHLELAEIHRRVYQNSGPALLFNNVRGCSFPVASNLFGTMDRARYIFRKTFDSVRMAIRWKTNPASALQSPMQLWRAPLVGMRMRPKLARNAPVAEHQCQIADLPQLTCWPDDGGPFVTLPQVLSQSLGSTRASGVNLGMYRVQLSGNDYEANEVGLHYQLHRGIGVHHSEAIARNQSFPVNVTVGGTPAMTLGAVMPLPEGLSELTFAGALGGHRIPFSITPGEAPVYADADFCIVGEVRPNLLKPEGPFGDHLGYYAKVHDFPVLKVKRVSHRRDAIWPMTVVGRPPQEDTTFGQLIHELTEPVIPSVLPGVRQVNAVDAAGVHPLLLVVGSERYTPYRKADRPQELLTQANAVLGQGQLSLAKYLWIVDGCEPDTPSAYDIAAFLTHALERINWQRDLHFHTCTTIDTLDYSGSGFNEGSKLVIAASGTPLRELPKEIPSELQIPTDWSNPKLVMPGILVIQAPQYSSASEQLRFQACCDQLSPEFPLCRFPLIVIVDDSDFASHNVNNFLWTTFTRSNPAKDVYGIGAQTVDKHFGCAGSLVIDARSKPQHAPGLIEDPKICANVDARAARGGDLSKYL